jgi:nucleoside-diphosphate-sugar epimerase
VKSLIVTGATGYIGRHVVERAQARGFTVIAASRRQPASPAVRWIPYQLDGELTPGDFPLAATLVHLAAETRAPSAATEALELAAARRLLAIARLRALRVVHVSSQAARADAPTAYGRAKWQVEQEILRHGGFVVRPGLVYGGDPGGVFAGLVDTVRRLPLLPAILPSPRVQPIHVEDLAEGLLRLAERGDLASGACNLAAEIPVTFTAFLRSIAVHRLRRRRLFIPVPAVALAAVLRVGGGDGAGQRERLRSLTDLPLLASGSDLAALGLRLRSLACGMHPSGCDRRRQLLREGSALMRYVLGSRAPRELIVRYVQAVERLRDGQPLALPRWALRWPCSLAVFDSRTLLDGAGAGELLWRLDAATALAEASPAGARSFLNIGERTTFATATCRIVGVLCTEAFWRLVRGLAGREVRRAAAATHE